MPKRFNDKQLTKDDWENEEGEDSEAGLKTFARASNEQLKKRRIITTTRRRSTFSPTAAAAGDNNNSGSGSSKNPFTKVNLSSTAPARPLMGSYSAKSTATAASATMNSSTFGAPQATFSFGNSSGKSPAPPPPAAKTTPLAGASQSNAFPSIPAKKVRTDSGSITSLSKNSSWPKHAVTMARRYAADVASAPALGDLSRQASKFISCSEKQKLEYEKESGGNSDTNENDGTTGGGFSFGGNTASASSAQGGSTSFGNFATSHNTAAGTATNFSFSAPTGSGSGLPSKATGVVSNDGTNDNSDKSPATTDTAAAAPDPDWEDVISFPKCKFYRQKDAKDAKSGWVSFCCGNLRLQKSKKDSNKSRMVLRDSVGIKVFVNIMITKDAAYRLTLRTNKKKMELAEISFLGVNSADRGFEPFRIMTVQSTGKELFQKLKELQQ